MKQKNNPAQILKDKKDKLDWQNFNFLENLLQIREIYGYSFPDTPMTSLGTLELQLTANQAALYQQLNQTKAYATQVAKDIEKQINQAFGSVGGNKLGGLNQATAQAAQDQYPPAAPCP